MQQTGEEIVLLQQTGEGIVLFQQTGEGIAFDMYRLPEFLTELLKNKMKKTGNWNTMPENKQEEKTIGDIILTN